MAAHNINLRLLFLSFTLLLSFHLARSDLSPSFSPGPGPESSESGPAPSPSSVGSTPLPTPSPSPSPSPSAGSGPAPSTSPESGPAPSSYVSFPPSEAISPNADSPAQSDGPSQFDDFSTTLAPNADVSPKVKQICDSTDHPALCLATIVPLLDGKTDVSSVLEVSMRAGAELAEFGLSLAKSIVGRPGVPPELASVLEDCKDSYDDVVYNFQNAFDAFPRRDIGTMNSMLSAVITNVGDCEDAVAKFGEESPLSSVADRLTNMTSNCLAIVSLLD